MHGIPAALLAAELTLNPLSVNVAGKLSVNTFFPPLLHLCLFVCLPGLASAATLFQDGFESGSLGPAWTVSTSNDGSGVGITNYGLDAGQEHLVLYDRV